MAQAEPKPLVVIYKDPKLPAAAALGPSISSEVDSPVNLLNTANLQAVKQQE